MKILKTSFIIFILLLSFTRSKAQSDNLSNSIDALANAYFDIKNALVSGDGKKAAIEAKEFIDKINKVPDKEMNTLQSKSWGDYNNKLQYDSRHISETTDVEHQREHFAPLSKDLYTVLKALKANKMNIYQQYCPMKKVYWLSENSIIKNPYYGIKMLDCGKTVQTLKPIK
jgi:hypothetical protein